MSAQRRHKKHPPRKRILQPLGPGSIVTLNRLAGEPVDLLVNGKPITRGEVVGPQRDLGVRDAALVGDVQQRVPTTRGTWCSGAVR